MPRFSTFRLPKILKKGYSHERCLAHCQRHLLPFLQFTLGGCIPQQLHRSRDRILQSICHMKPYYEHDGIVIYHGDCREILPHLPKVDLVLADPPYGINYVSGPNSKSSISTKKKRFQVSIIGDDKEFDPAPFLVAHDVMFTGAQHFYHLLPAGGSLHTWDKRGPYEALDQADTDLIWHNRKRAGRVFHCVWRGICRSVEWDQRIEHPTQKPITLMQWCIVMVPDAVFILDPFMGSGTTLVAAKRLGRQAIGIEIEEKYCEIAARRVEAERLTLFEYVQETQGDLFHRMTDTELAVLGEQDACKELALETARKPPLPFAD